MLLENEADMFLYYLDNLYFVITLLLHWLTDWLDNQRKLGGALAPPWISHSTPKKIIIYLLLLFNVILRYLLCDNNI